MSQFSLSVPSVNRNLAFGDNPPPVRLAEKYRPSTLPDVVGQGAVIYRLQSFADAPFPTPFIFSGGTGVGKTTCARALASDMGVNLDWDFHEVKSAAGDAEAIEAGLKMLRFAGQGGGWKMLLIDEADTMSDKAKKLLLSALEDLPNRSIVVMTTNHPDKFDARFLDRCEVLTFASDCNLLLQDAQSLANRVWSGETGEPSAPDVATMVNLCQAGSMSFRRVVNAVADLLRQRPSTPIGVFGAEPIAAPWTLPEPFGDSEGLPTHRPIHTPEIDTTVTPENTPMEAAPKPRSADEIILEAIDAYRDSGPSGMNSIWSRTNTTERKRINKRLLDLACDVNPSAPAKTPFAQYARFVRCVERCVTGPKSRVSPNAPSVSPDASDEPEAQTPAATPIASPCDRQTPSLACGDDSADPVATPSGFLVETTTAQAAQSGETNAIDPERQARIDAWKERKIDRAERLRDRAASARKEAATRFGSHNIETLRDMAGEPIKIGHHSEKRHRKLIERADNDMRKGCEATAKAKHYEARAESIESNDAISSRDPEAIDLLREKLTEREALQARMKATNDAHKRYLKNPSSLDAADLPESTKATIRGYKPAYSWEPHPYAPYQLTNNNKEIRRIQGRIEEIEKRATVVAKEDVEIEGVRISEDAEFDTVQLFYPGKPDEATRAKLKANGFRWARSIGAWTRRRSNRTTWLLSTMFPGYGEVAKPAPSPSDFPDVPPVSGGSPEVAEMVAERLAIVAEIAQAIALPALPTRLDKLARHVSEYVLLSVARLREVPARLDSPYWPWYSMGDSTRASFLEFLDAMGLADDDLDGAARFVLFVNQCVKGSPVDFPAPEPEPPSGFSDDSLDTPLPGFPETADPFLDPIIAQCRPVMDSALSRDDIDALAALGIAPVCGGAPEDDPAEDFLGEAYRHIERLKAENAELRAKLAKVEADAEDLADQLAQAEADCDDDA